MIVHDERQSCPPAVKKRLSVYERWSWSRCQNRIRSLSHRLGYNDQIWILGFKVLDDGCIIDLFHKHEVFNPATTHIPLSIPYHSLAIAEMYCLLSTYANATELPLSGDQVSPNTINPMQRFTFKEMEVKHLLQYREQDFNKLRAVSPFFLEKLHYGDLSFTLQPLPRVPLTIVVWEGEDRIASEGAILFDKTVTHYLPGLTIELAGLTVWRLRNILDPSVRWGYSAYSS